MQAAFKKFKESNPTNKPPPGLGHPSSSNSNTLTVEPDQPYAKFDFLNSDNGDSDDDDDPLKHELLEEVASIWRTVTATRQLKESADTNEPTTSTNEDFPYSDEMAALFQEELTSHGIFPLTAYKADQKWFQRLESYSIKRLVTKLNEQTGDDDEEIDFSIENSLADLTKYAIKTLPKSIVKEIESDVTKTVDKLFEAIPLTILPDKEQECRRVNLLQEYIDKFNGQQQDTVEKKRKRNQTDPIGHNYNEQWPYRLFNYANTPSCQSPYDAELIIREEQNTFDPEELFEKLSEIPDEPDIPDLAKALEPALGLCLKPDQHSDLITYIHSDALQTKEMFEDMKYTFDENNYVIYTCFYEGVWYKLVIEKEFALWTFEEVNLEHFHGCWMSKKVPEKRIGYPIGHGGTARKRPLTQAEKDSIAMPPPKLPRPERETAQTQVADLD